MTSILWKWKSLSHVQIFATHGLYSPWNSLGQNTGVFVFSRGSSQPRDQTQVSHIASGFFTSWATKEAQESWSGKPIPSPADLPNPEIELGSPALQVDSLQLSYEGSPPFYHLMSTVNCIICGLPFSLFGLVLWGPTAKFLSIMQVMTGTYQPSLYPIP